MNWLFIFLLTALSFSKVMAQKSYYISSSIGNNSNNGLTEATAWNSIMKVNAQTFSAGDVIAFKKGDIFDDTTLVIDVDGASENEITFTSYGSGNRPIIGNTTTTRTSAINITGGADYIILDGLHVIVSGTSGSTYGIKIDDLTPQSTYITINDCEIEGGVNAHKDYKYGIRNYSANFTLSYSEIHDINNGLYLYDPYNVELHHNLFYETYGDVGEGAGNHINTASSVYPFDCEHTFLIYNNEFTEWDGRAMGLAHLKNTIIEYNYFHDPYLNTVHGESTLANADANIIGKMGDHKIPTDPSGYQIFRYNIIENIQLGIINEDQRDDAVFHTNGRGDWVYGNVFINTWGAVFNRGNTSTYTRPTQTTSGTTVFGYNTCYDIANDDGGEGYGLYCWAYGTNSYSPTKVHNNVFNIGGNDRGAMTKGSMWYYGDNAWTNRSGVYRPSDSSPPSTAAWWLATGAGTDSYLSLSGDEDLFNTSTSVWNDVSGTIDIPNVGISGVTIPDLRPSATSSLIDEAQLLGNDPAGNNADAYDIMGNARTNPDIGAFEFVFSNDNSTSQLSNVPTITKQPINQNKTSGSLVSFIVSATCDDEIGYQWWKYPFVSVSESKIPNTSKYSGATTNTLIINDVNDSDNNTKYVCKIYNTNDPSNRWVNSEITTLTVISNSLSTNFKTPIITQQPENKTANTNSNIIFSTNATCDNEIGYQWWKYPFVSVLESKISNTSKYSGATTNTLTISNVINSDDNTKYVCEIFNSKDPSNRWINSEITTLTVTSNSISSNFETPIITKQPKSITVNENEDVSFIIEATCEDEVGYQWWKSPFVNENESKIVNSTKYLGTTTNQLVIKDAQNTDADVSYVCEVYNKMDLTNLKTHSDIAGLTVLLNNNSTTPMSELKVILEGSFQKNGMLTILNEKDILPKTQPYNISPFNYSSYQKVDVFTNNIVDWVLIELRSDENTLVKQFAALLRNDGIVLNSLGTQDFTNHSIEDGDYYLVIHHRNHLSIMSKNKIIINNSVLNYNFSTSVDQAYGTNSMVELENGYFAMYSGDGDANNIISKLDFGSVANNILTTGYEFGDIDMNGIINVLDYSNINKNISVKSHVP